MVEGELVVEKRTSQVQELVDQDNAKKGQEKTFSGNAIAGGVDYTEMLN